MGMPGFPFPIFIDEHGGDSAEIVIDGSPVDRLKRTFVVIGSHGSLAGDQGDDGDMLGRQIEIVKFELEINS